jgi:hypothetical protein
LKEVILYLIYVMSYKCFILLKKSPFGHIMLCLVVPLLVNWHMLMSFKVQNWATSIELGQTTWKCWCQRLITIWFQQFKVKIHDIENELTLMEMWVFYPRRTGYWLNYIFNVAFLQQFMKCLVVKSNKASYKAC